jgi:hypothetical protein
LFSAVALACVVKLKLMLGVAPGTIEAFHGSDGSFIAAVEYVLPSVEIFRVYGGSPGGARHAATARGTDAPGAAGSNGADLPAGHEGTGTWVVGSTRYVGTESGT